MSCGLANEMISAKGCAALPVSFFQEVDGLAGDRAVVVGAAAAEVRRFGVATEVGRVPTVESVLLDVDGPREGLRWAPYSCATCRGSARGTRRPAGSGHVLLEGLRFRR